ncbi:MAG: histidine triad nucleotide-binding protein [Desulfomonilia bacterium]|jgi:histidine triad (HIT) family protein|nr:histidine triad nucleotide-binding protein [Deltaproteobacteria bacterium]MDX9760633.1 histidine triad nucleotide-binding protein [Desulfomonilia bacterium]HPW68851.1 histidine triad nucleotide-binding protein [Deltaproteobacteria bacterium]
MGCIFCKIAGNEVPSNKVYEDDLVLAFDDVQPLAPVHAIVIPKKHYQGINDLDDKEIWFAMLRAAQEVAKRKGVEKSGYRLVINSGEHGTQIVRHLHLHVLGGRQLESGLG